MTGNREHDCHDDSTGSGTAGTANAWNGNQGATENRAGLCRQKTKHNDDEDDDDKERKRKKKDKDRDGDRSKGDD